MLSRFSDTQKKLDMFEATHYKAIPSWDECKSCKIKDCLVKIQTDPNEYVDFQSLSTLYPENNNKVKLPTLI